MARTLSTDLRYNPSLTVVATDRRSDQVYGATDETYDQVSTDVATYDPRYNPSSTDIATDEMLKYLATDGTDDQVSTATDDPRDDDPASADVATELTDDLASTDVATDEHDYFENDEDEDGEYYEDIEDELLFEKRATLLHNVDGEWQMLGLGDMCVTYEDDVGGYRIMMETTDGLPLCSHIITKEYNISCDETMKCCHWLATDYATDEPVDTHFLAKFSSKPVTIEFRDLFQEGLKLAADNDISKFFTQELLIPESGVGAGGDSS